VPQDALTSNPVDNMFVASNETGTGKTAINGAAAIRVLFKSVKEILLSSDDDEPQPARRRRGETDKGFAAACRSILRRAARSEVSAVSDAALYLSDTLDWLNLWQDNAGNDHWQEDDFSATYWDNFPQP
jgi:hypothetical protein